MSEIDLVVFDLAGTTIRDADHVSTALAATLATLGLPIPVAEIESLRGASKRDAIQDLLLRYSPEQAKVETIDRLFADFNRKLQEMQRKNAVRPVEGVEEVFRWLRARGIKVALTTGFDRKTATGTTVGLKWNAGVVDAMVCSEDVKTGRPAPYLIFRAMEITGAGDVRRVAVLGNMVLDLHAGANAGVGMNVGVLSGAVPKEQMEAAPHTHLIESIRKFPPLLGAPGSSGKHAAAVPPPAPATTATPEAAPAPENKEIPPFPGFSSGAGLPT